MGRVRKFWASPRQFKWLLIEAWARLGVPSLLRFLPLREGAGYLMREHRGAWPLPKHPPTCEEICRAVEAAGGFLPGATCLAKARVGCAMLNRFGYPAEIRLGVLKKLSELEAHAWVECGGMIVIGKNANEYIEFQKTYGTAMRNHDC
jgi:Transglutaminase-like superfamily